MNVAIKIDGTTQTSHVISYQREHKICSGIGTLDIVLDNSYSGPTAPWTNVDIWENGDFKVRYYVSQATQSDPAGTITLECQDISKRLVDYFIPDSYTIDYPSYTKYWISKFLDEAGINYEFTAAGSGNLLSNYTALGLQSGYDQIMTLLQLSGWFMYFDGNGKAIIGSLDIDLAEPAGKVDNTDIIDIKRLSNDKMLRNRAVVWGQYDAIRGEYAYADISKTTPWNYDRRDQRAIVISNNNIPNASSAYSIANVLLKEFTKPTIEKHITLWGARDYNLGEALNVSSGIWRGKGLITTFGTSMDRNGLITNLVLDERCPRLFGFFDFGDYVYVGTFGNGVWRKHIKFDPAWYNFSTGLMDLNITDLHINQDIFGAVSASGEMYYANSNSGPWNRITLSGLPSSTEDTTTSGIVTYTSFSGLYGRATIVDRTNNTVKFGVDTWSGLNTGDYFLTYSGMLTSVTTSGITTSGMDRGWIVEYDPFTGALVGDLGSGIYPINYSGNYDLRVMDLENDGRNDYVSVALGGGGIGPAYVTASGNFGHHYTQPFGSTRDYTSYSVYPDAASIAEINNMVRGDSEFASLIVASPSALIAIDDQISGYTYSISVAANGVAKKTRFKKIFNGTYWDVTKVTTTSGTTSLRGGAVLGIYPDLGADTYRVFYRGSSGSAPNSIEYYYKDWNALANSWGSEVLVGSATLQGAGTGYLTRCFTLTSVVTGNTIKDCISYVRSLNNSTSFGASSFFYVNVSSINMETPTLVSDDLFSLETIKIVGETNYYYYNDSVNAVDPVAASNLTVSRPYAKIFQKEGETQIIGRAEWYYRNLSTNLRGTREYLFYGTDTVLQYNEYYIDEQITTSNIRRFRSTFTPVQTQLTTLNAIIVGEAGVVGGNSFAYNGTTFYMYAGAFTGVGSVADAVPYQYQYQYVYPGFLNNDNQYIAYNPDDGLYYKCSATTLLPVEAITVPTGYSLESFTSTGFGPFSESVYATLSDDNSGDSFLCPYNYDTFDLSRALFTQDDGSNYAPSFINRAIVFGNFFIEDAGDYTVVSPTAGVYYVDLGAPDWEAARFLVLQRDGLDYHLIQESAKPIRVEISNNSPVLTVLDQENTFISNFVYGQELTQVVPVSGLLARDVRDYRYTLLETTSSGTIVGSGVGVASQVLYVSQSGVWNSNVESYSGGFMLMAAIPSGVVERIETTNYASPGQFLFVTTSGDNPTFYQRDNEGLYGMMFVEYSGLPSNSRATIIRVDDMV